LAANLVGGIGEKLEIFSEIPKPLATMK